MPIPSPFESVHQRSGANFAEYDGWSLPNDFGDIAAEKTALKEASAAFDLSSFGKIKITGADSEDLIEKLMPDPSAQPDDEECVFAKFSDDDVTIRIGCVDDTYTIFTKPRDRQSALAAIQKAADDNQLTELDISDITEKTGMISIYGPQAVKSIANILPFDVTDLEPNEIVNMSFIMIQVTIIRGSWTGTDGIELLCPKSACAMAAAAVAKYRDRENITPAGMETLLSAIK